MQKLMARMTSDGKNDLLSTDACQFWMLIFLIPMDLFGAQMLDYPIGIGAKLLD